MTPDKYLPGKPSLLVVRVEQEFQFCTATFYASLVDGIYLKKKQFDRATGDYRIVLAKDKQDYCIPLPIIDRKPSILLLDDPGEISNVDGIRQVAKVARTSHIITTPESYPWVVRSSILGMRVDKISHSDAEFTHEIRGEDISAPLVELGKLATLNGLLHRSPAQRARENRDHNITRMLKEHGYSDE